MAETRSIMIDENFFADLDNDAQFRKRVKSILDMAYAGIIFVDETCTIKLMNNKYEDLLNLSDEEAYGRHVLELFPDSRLPAVIASGKAELGHKYSFGKKKTLVLNRIPLMIGKKIGGAVTQCLFSDLSELKFLATKLDVLETEVQYYKKQLNNLLSARYTFDHIIGESEAIVNAKNIANLYARHESPVLILGDTGTGKELFAHAVHNESPRSLGPFVCLNCAAIPKDLIGSELFGYAPGAFSGAHYKGKVGKIELADRGTLFLDEIGDLSLEAQATLLRVLEEKRVSKIGAMQPKSIDFRLISATNKDLGKMRDNNQFRDDLYHRISTMPLYIPSLKTRISDIPVLIDHFLHLTGKPQTRLSAEALELFHRYCWPGNVRELKNEIERSVSLADESDTIEIRHLNPCIVFKNTDTPSEFLHRGIDEAHEVEYQKDKYEAKNGPGSFTPKQSRKGFSKEPEKNAPNSTSMKFNHRIVLHEDEMLKDGLAQYEINAIIKALEICNGNKVKAAKFLGISRSRLYRKIKEYAIPF